MTEPQFTYGNFTLDELRSLAASPQVGTMQAMPQSFRALADQVGEVADLLSHAQADLPNWWKGPAAQQAAATLGRAAAEAREFHDSAMGAATAVSRCAQVVAEQQNQMMNVPDVHEPGISAVVQRPTTPFEALEAARQDAAYQAAHEQAVQVVNGIAAQYVETRAALSTVSTAGGENFTSPLLSGPFASGVPDTLTSEPFHANVRAATIAENGQPRSHLRTVDEAKIERPFHDSGSDSLPEKQLPHSYLRLEKTLATPSTSATRSSETVSKHATKLVVEPSEDFKSSTIPYQKTSPPRGEADKNQDQLTAPDSQAISKEASTLHNARKSYSQINEDGRHNELLLTDPAKKIAYSRFSDQTTSNTVKSEMPESLDGNKSSAPPSLELPNLSHYDTSNGEGPAGAMIPPYSGVSGVRRANEDRNPRPAYLKERKSAWLPDTIAVPADGVITPEWLRHP